jgi:hypothetical protein
LSVPAGADNPVAAELDTYPVTPADGTDLPSGGVNGVTQQTQFLEATGAGNIAVNLFGGGTATLTGLAAGQRVRVGATRVLATGTTATGILAHY